MTFDVAEPLMLGQLSRDLRNATATLGRDEVRFLVDTYYAVQEFRKAGYNQARALTASEEPHATVAFFADQFDVIESQLKAALDAYSASDPMGQWARGVLGIGPVIAAGLSAHIDIERAPTVGHIWRFAGLDPTVKWEKGQKRPWNASLKVLCWKIGDSFVKNSNRENCFYGKVYRERKQYELDRDARGGNAEAAATTLKERNIRDKETRAIYESGHLPLGRLDLRARRYATKLFLAHWHEAAYVRHHGTEPPLPYPIAHLGHTHKIDAASGRL